MSSSNGSRVKAIARIDVMLKPEISDPQGQTVSRALPSLGTLTGRWNAAGPTPWGA